MHVCQISSLNDFCDLQRMQFIDQKLTAFFGVQGCFYRVCANLHVIEARNFQLSLRRQVLSCNPKVSYFAKKRQALYNKEKRVGYQSAVSQIAGSLYSRWRPCVIDVQENCTMFVHLCTPP